jgi:hypothetical protein
MASDQQIPRFPAVKAPDMHLIDRYLAAVGVLLPREQREDITAELRDALVSRGEEKEAEVGRALTAEEESELLRGFGHPITVAARYGRGQYLIGPELYPLYVLVLKILMAIMALSALVVGAVAEALHPGDWAAAVRAGLAAFWHGAVTAIAVVTITVAVLERYNIRLGFLTHWNPADLPKAPYQPSIRTQTRFEHAAAILAQTVFILWWIHVLPGRLPYLTYVPLGADQHLDLAPAPIWRTLFWPVFGLSLAAITVHTLMLLGQARRDYARGLALSEHIAAFAIGLIALRAGHWVDVSGGELPPAALAKVDYGVNFGFEIGLIAVVVIAASLAAHDAWRLYSSRSRMA